MARHIIYNILCIVYITSSQEVVERFPDQPDCVYAVGTGLPTKDATSATT